MSVNWYNPVQSRNGDCYKVRLAIGHKNCSPSIVVAFPYEVLESDDWNTVQFGIDYHNPLTLVLRPSSSTMYSFRRSKKQRKTNLPAKELAVIYEYIKWYTKQTNRNSIYCTFSKKGNVVEVYVNGSYAA